MPAVAAEARSGAGRTGSLVSLREPPAAAGPGLLAAQACEGRRRWLRERQAGRRAGGGARRREEEETGGGVFRFASARPASSNPEKKTEIQTAEAAAAAPSPRPRWG